MSDEPDYKKYSGKTLVLCWKVQQEWRVPIGHGAGNVSEAVHQAMNSPIAAGIPGVIPESIHVRIED